jgi:hypothetical protein
MESDTKMPVVQLIRDSLIGANTTFRSPFGDQLERKVSASFLFFLQFITQLVLKHSYYLYSCSDYVR